MGSHYSRFHRLTRPLVHSMHCTGHTKRLGYDLASIRGQSSRQRPSQACLWVSNAGAKQPTGGGLERFHWSETAGVGLAHYYCKNPASEGGEANECM